MLLFWLETCTICKINHFYVIISKFYGCCFYELDKNLSNNNCGIGSLVSGSHLNSLYIYSKMCDRKTINTP